MSTFPIDDLGVQRIRPGGDTHHCTDRENWDALAKSDHREIVEAERAATVTVATEVVPEVRGVEGDGGVYRCRPSRDNCFEIALQPIPLFAGYGVIASRHGRGQQGPVTIRTSHLRPVAKRQ
ncbi:hypothetical protein [Streptomyces sp. NBC_00063]|uniref:hypothetical protein n=1 Tax=Streptomyces sp. NBC_00063 TaxID=2975638 RepID=UPI00225069C9|nr:hypothetical protein [Streptomyces sp. NBC_00063]MCX5441261.1 hypothetical protein [Streptomyces sp. NBC_00063]